MWATLALEFLARVFSASLVAYSRVLRRTLICTQFCSVRLWVCECALIAVVDVDVASPAPRSPIAAPFVFASFLLLCLTSAKCARNNGASKVEIAEIYPRKIMKIIRSLVKSVREKDRATTTTWSEDKQWENYNNNTIISRTRRWMNEISLRPLNRKNSLTLRRALNEVSFSPFNPMFIMAYLYT